MEIQKVPIIRLYKRKSRLRSNFDNIKVADVLRYTTYDCDSIMQYGEFAFFRAPKILKTMGIKKPDCKLKEPYEKPGLTSRHKDIVNKIYQCK
ncbi:unnamed protein product [Larinioides sclopetarius]|uniref:Uncharacterized protein n=2 Tax=Larinioides sclopetarius TaxID=280406 RepID=A0AAV2AGR3_9ARAC